MATSVCSLVTCRRCGEEHSEEAFTPAQLTKPAPWCRCCVSSYNRAYKQRGAHGRRVVQSRAVAPGHKQCANCREHLPTDRFIRNQGTRDGLGSYCKPCAVLKQTESKVRAGWVRRVGMSPEQQLVRRNDLRLQKLYGITTAERDAMAVGGCWICGETETGLHGTLHVDHDHSKPGTMRGILCSGCNRAIGYISDDPERAMRLAAYLQADGAVVRDLDVSGKVL